MSRKSSCRTEGRSHTRNHSLRSYSSLGRSLYHRQLRREPLEDRRLLAVITVATLSDTVDFNDGVTSLREAIFAANTVPGADTIEFAPNLTAAGPAKILLTQGELAITYALTIDGPGSGLLTIDAQGNSRLFELAPAGSYTAGPPPIGVCTIAGLTLTGGRASGPSDPFGGNASGGAIRSATSSPLTIDDCIITANQADNGVGEAIFSQRDLILVDCTISQNTSSSQSGVAAYSFGRITATDTAIRNNQGDGIDAWGDVTLVRSIVEANGTNAGLGSGVFSLGNVRVDDSAVRNNTAGGIVAKGTVSLRQSILSGNTGGLVGSFESSSPAGTPQLSRGARIYAHGGVELFDSTVSGNSGAALGCGVFSGGSVSLSGSTISENGASMYGGGLFATGDVTIHYCTIANNLADGRGGGIFANRNVHQIVIAGSILAGNTIPLFGLRSDIYSATAPIKVTSSIIGDNYQTSLAESSVGLPDANGNLIGGPVHGVIDPLLGPLADNGGFELPDGSHILTHALLPGSPAINVGDLNAVAGQNGVPEFDERGTPFGRVFGGRIDIGAFEYQTPSDLNLLVDTLVDESDGNYSRGDLSLREAIELANLYPGADTIHFDRALTAAGPATILLMHGELAITGDTTIVGPGASLLAIDANGQSGARNRVFDVDDGIASTFIDVTISSLTLTGGYLPGGGGQVFSDEALTILGTTISGNPVLANGGGIVRYGGGLVLRDSTITGNARSSGGGIFVTNGDLTIDNSVISENTSSYGGGIAFLNRSGSQFNLAIRDSAISGNRGRQGNSLEVAMFGGNLEISDSSITNNVPTGFARNGGGVYLNLKHATAIFDGDTIRDNGAYSGGGIFANVTAGETLITDCVISSNTADKNNGLGGGIYKSRTDSAGGITVRNAAIDGNSASQGGGIYVATSKLTIEESSILKNSVNNGPGGGVFGHDISISNSIISGNTAAGSGGGVYSIDVVTLTRCKVDDSRAGKDGGGIGGATLTQHGVVLSYCDVLDNYAAGNGGEIGSKSRVNVTLTNSTLDRNGAGALGGGLYAISALVRNSVIAGNGADVDGGNVFVRLGASVQLYNSIVLGGIGGFIGSIIEPRFCLITDNTQSGLTEAPIGSPDANGNIIGGPVHGVVDSMLRPLADNGGFLLPDGSHILTHALLPGSPAIDAGDPSAVAGVNGVPASDERGVPFTRVFGGRIDIGAVEYEPAGFLAGDYNRNGIVDAADFIVWREARGLNVTVNGGGADGNGDGVVDELDYDVCGERTLARRCRRVVVERVARSEE